MKKFLLVLKIIIAIALIGGIGYFAFNYLSLQYSFQKQEEDNKQAEADRQRLAEENKITYEDADEEKLKLFENYMEKIYVDFQENEPIPEFDKIRDVKKDFITLVAFYGGVRGYYTAQNISEAGESIYTYDEINSYLVSLFGKDGHNLFDRVTDVSGYFTKTTDGYSIIGMGGSETISYDYFIDSLKKGSDGKYYGYVYEYIINTPDGPILDKEQSGAICRILNTKQSALDVDDNNVINDNIIKEYTIEVVEEGDTLSYNVKDGDRIVDIETEYKNVAKENKDKLVEKELILTYDETLNCFYLNLIKIVNK